MTADDDMVFIKSWPLTGAEGRSIYQMPLSVNGSSPTTADKIVQQSDDISNNGFIYNYKSKSVLWAFGKEIKSISIDDNSISTLADICKYSTSEMYHIYSIKMSLKYEFNWESESMFYYKT